MTFMATNSNLHALKSIYIYLFLLAKVAYYNCCGNSVIMIRLQLGTVPGAQEL